MATDVITVVPSHMPHKNMDIMHSRWKGALNILPPMLNETAQLPAGATTRVVQGPAGGPTLYIHTEAHRSGKLGC